MHIQKLIDSNRQFGLLIVGGGQTIIGDLTKNGGASQFLLESSVPYSRNALVEYLGGTPDKAVSAATALSGAMVAYQRGCKLSPESDMIGVASTSSLGTGAGEREGRIHQTFIATQSRYMTILYHFEFGETRTRRQEELLVARLIGEAMYAAIRIPERMDFLLGPKDRFERRGVMAEPGWSKIIHEPGKISPALRSDALFSSSCNPLGPHHVEIMRHAAEKLGHPIDLELCVTNPDKSPLDYFTLWNRVRQIEELTHDQSWFGNLFITSTPLFIDKARAFPACKFIVGLDTIDRISDPTYYKGKPDTLRDHINFMHGNGNRFLVYDRVGHELCDVLTSLPNHLRILCYFIGAKDGYLPTNMSSTSLRKGQ